MNAAKTVVESTPPCAAPLPAANTTAIKAGRYLFDMQTTDTQGTVTRVLEGIITVTPEITR